LGTFIGAAGRRFGKGGLGVRRVVPGPFIRAAAGAVAGLIASSCALHPANPAIPSDLPALPKAWAKEPVILLADSSFWSVVPGAGGANSLECRTASWYRVNRRNPSLLEDMIFFDDETTEKPPLVRVDAFYPDGKTFVADGKSLPRERARMQGTFSSNGFERALRLPGYREGMTIRVETRRSVFRPEYRSREFLRGEYPCLRRYVAFRYPAGYDLRVDVRNGEKLALAIDTVRAAPREGVPGYTEIRVAAADLARMRPFNRSRYPEEWHAALHFGVPSQGTHSWDWKEIGDRYLAMIAPSLKPSQEAAAAAARIPELPRDTSPGAAPPPGAVDSTVARVFDMVKDHIRYLADEEALSAYVPRSPAQVLANGYGDCKEMANLMRALLRAKGIASGLALVRSPGGPQLLEDFPSLGPFDHVILWRRAGDGGLRFYDPTVSSAQAGNSYLPLLGQKALLLSEGGSVTDTVAAAPGYRNRAYTRSRLLPGKSGGWWELRGEVALKGKAAFDLNLALRNRFQVREEARGAIGNFLAADFGIRATEWDWQSPAADSLSITFAMPAQGMAVRLGAGGVKLDVPTLMGMGSLDLDFDGDRMLTAFEQEDQWILPPGYRKLERRNLSAGPAMAAEGRWTASGEKIRRDFKSQGKVWKAEEKSGLANFLGAVTDFSSAAVWR
jgi:hypothetical protein